MNDVPIASVSLSRGLFPCDGVAGKRATNGLEQSVEVPSTRSTPYELFGIWHREAEGIN